MWCGFGIVLCLHLTGWIWYLVCLHLVGWLLVEWCCGFMANSLPVGLGVWLKLCADLVVSDFWCCRCCCLGCLLLGLMLFGLLHVVLWVFCWFGIYD